MSGQTYYILALVVAILAAGFVFQYSESGAGIVGLMVLFIFSYFNPDAAIFMLGTHIVSVMELTVITVFTIAAAYLLKLNF